MPEGPDAPVLADNPARIGLFKAIVTFEGETLALHDGDLVGELPACTHRIQNGSGLIGYVRSKRRDDATILEFVPQHRMHIGGRRGFAVTGPFMLEVGLEFELCPGRVATVDEIIPGHRIRETTINATFSLEVWGLPDSTRVRFIADGPREVVIANKPARLVLALLRLGATSAATAAPWADVLALVELAEDADTTVLGTGGCHCGCGEAAAPGTRLAGPTHAPTLARRIARFQDDPSWRAVFDQTVYRARKALSNQGVRWPMPVHGKEPTLIVKAGSQSFYLNDQGVEVRHA